MAATEVEMAFKGRVCKGEGPCSWAPMMGWNIEMRIVGVCFLFFGWRFLEDGRIVTRTGIRWGGAVGGARGRARLAGTRLGSACCCSCGEFGGWGVVSLGMLLVCGGEDGWV